jgi:uncharacterized protein YjiK
MSSSVSGPSGTSRPPKFKFDESYKLDVKEPSGLAYLPEMDRFVAVDDASRKLVSFQLKKHKLKQDVLDSSPGGRDSISDFEGVAYDPERKRLITVSERSRRIRTFQLLADQRRNEPSGLRQTGEARLPRLGQDPNKGIEGLAFLPGKFSPDGRSHLVAVNEADPKAVLLLDPDSLKLQHQLPLPKKWDKDVKDLSDIAVDPVSGHLFVLSDQSRQVLELELRLQDGELDLAKVQRFDIERKGTGKIQQAEGIAFDREGNLYIASEGSRRLYRYRRE